nr:hypothetical protein [Candidatus Gracilibacteria bacterium]
MIALADINTKFDREQNGLKAEEEAIKFIKEDLEFNLNIIFPIALQTLALHLKIRYPNYNVLNLKKFKNKKIIFSESKSNEWKQIKDTLGAVKINSKTNSIEIFLNVLNIVRFHIGSGNTNFPRLMYSVMCHEIAHLLSSEVLDEKTSDTIIKVTEKIQETVIQDGYSPPPIWYMRSGISVHIGDYVLYNGYNEGLTDFIGEEFFKILCEKGIIELNLDDFVKSYINERDGITTLAQQCAEYYGEDINEVFEKFKKGYFLGGFELYKLFEYINNSNSN